MGTQELLVVRGHVKAVKGLDLFESQLRQPYSDFALDGHQLLELASCQIPHPGGFGEAINIA